MTQEQVAEALGVSRQTMSNWENEKTYPDIISVIKMSDLYNISLDLLLKEEKSMTNYLDYLEESTNVVKSKKQIGKLILIMSYLLLWGISVGLFWFAFVDPTDVMGFEVLFELMLIPFISFVISIIIAVNNYWGKLKWLAPIVFGAMLVLFSVATVVVRCDNFSIYSCIMYVLYGAISSAIGLGIGTLVNYIRAKKK